MSVDVDPEAEIRSALERGHHATAGTLVVQHYGSDIMTFLRARVGDQSGVAEEVFSMFVERLWAALPRFDSATSVQSWAYRLARNAANEFAASTRGGSERDLAPARATIPLAGARDHVRALREALPPDDQMLLFLRVDRGMGWRDLAAALTDGEDPIDAETLDQLAEPLRERFERIKEDLRELAAKRRLL